jgi:hypothetical protein
VRIDRRSLWPGLALAALLIVLVVIIFPVRYEANDDFAIVRQLSPASRMPTDPHVHYMGWALAAGLHRLYALAPAIPWFGVTLYISLWLGFGLIIGLLLRLAPALRWGLAVAAGVLLVCLVECVVLVSFTSVALLLLFAVFLALTEWALGPSPPVGTPRLYQILLVLAFVLGFSMRWQLALAVLPLAAPVLLFLRWRRIHSALVFIIPVVALLAIDQTVHHLGGGEAQQRFAEYNLLRTRFHDTANGRYHGESTERAAAAAGWKGADFTTYHHWVLFDDQLFNTETLRTFLELNRPDKSESVAQVIARSVAVHWSRFWPATVLFFCGLIALWLAGRERLRSYVADRWRQGAVLGLIVAAVLVLFGYRYVPRVFIPLFVYGLAMGGLMAAGRPEGAPAGPRLPAWRRIALVLLAGGVLFTGSIHGRFVVDLAWRTNKHKRYLQGAMAEAVRRLEGRDPVLVLMDATKGVMLDALNPLREFADLVDLRIFPGGTSVNSPRYNMLLGQLGLAGGRDFLHWLIDNPRALLVLDSSGTEDSQYWERLWLGYYRRNVAPETPLRLVPALDYRNESRYGLTFYQLRRAGTPTDS